MSLIQRSHYIVVILHNTLPVESEGLFYGIVSLLHVVPGEEVAGVLQSLCGKMVCSANKDNGHIMVKL